MGKGYRSGRLGEEIKKIISSMLLREIKDPKLLESMVSVSAVEVTNDGSYATVYISVLGSGNGGFATDEEKDEILRAFGRAKGLIKREIGKKIKLRHVSELLFKIDNSMEYGIKMSSLIDGLGIENYQSDEEDDAPAGAPAAEDGAESMASEIDDIMKDL